MTTPTAIADKAARLMFYGLILAAPAWTRFAWCVGRIVRSRAARELPMVESRIVTTLLMATLGASVSACSTPGFEDYCRYSEEHSIREADPRSLALVLGVRPGLAMETPFVVVRSLSENNPGASVTLYAAAAPHPIPTSLDESRCAAVDWSTYTLTVDDDKWSAFWSDDRNSPFEIAIAFLDTNESLLVSKFGAAIVDTAASEYLVSCGCYWK